VLDIRYCKKKAEVYYFNKPSFSEAKSPGTPEKEWDSVNSMVMTWFWKSMELSVSANFMFHTTMKAIWDIVRATYSLENIASRS